MIKVKPVSQRQKQFPGENVVTSTGGTANTKKIANKGLFKKNLLFQNWKCHAYSNGKRSTVPESLIIMALETVFLPKKFARKRVQEMGEVTLVARKSL